MRQLAVISVIWVLAGLITVLYEYFFLANYPGVLSTTAMEEYDLGKNAIAAMGGLFVGSILFCLVELFIFQNRLKREAFWKAILKKLLVYAGLLFILITGISLIFNSILSDRSIIDREAWSSTLEFLASKAIWHPIIPILILAFFSSFILQLSERFGTYEMWKMFSGKYFNPKEEWRIFMFLDLNSSTTLAERLGNEKFYSYLNDFYHDIAPVITAYKGDVVEYVGDQVVITWTLSGGVLDTRCLKCYQEFEKTIEKKNKLYLEKYGAVPDFKAAVHCGLVMIGEMGKIKKTIKFSGDVLNTTARVEKICGTLGAKMLVTSNVVEALENSPFPLEKIRDIQLKGKENAVDLYKVVV